MALASSLQLAHYTNSWMPKARSKGRKGSGKTRRGAVHVQGKVFLGRRKFNGTPAEYRRGHHGHVTIKPNYKLPHAKPKARNVQ
jgi:hypothetical protein